MIITHFWIINSSNGWIMQNSAYRENNILVIRNDLNGNTNCYAHYLLHLIFKMFIIVHYDVIVIVVVIIIITLLLLCLFIKSQCGVRNNYLSAVIPMHFSVGS